MGASGQDENAQKLPPVTVLLSSLRQHIERLIRGERALISAELAARRQGITVGSGMLAATALVGFFGFAALETLADAAVALALPAWLSALLIALALLLLAGILVLLGIRILKGNPDAGGEQ